MTVATLARLKRLNAGRVEHVYARRCSRIERAEPSRACVVWHPNTSRFKLTYWSSGLPHSYPGAAEGIPDRLAELTPILEMANEARNVAQPPPDVSP